MSGQGKILAGLSVVMLLATPHPLFAQNVPSRDTAGAEQQRFEKDAKLKTVARQLEKETREPEEEAVVEESKPGAAGEEGPAFELKTIRYTGNDSIPSSELDAISAGYLKKKVGMKDLKELASRIKKEYRDQGFIGAYVYLPPQDVTTGDVQIAVIEGLVGEVEVKDNKWFSERVIKRMLGITSGSVLFYDQLRAGLSFLNRQRDLKARAVLKPGKEPKTTDVEVSVKDHFPIHVGTEVHNLGTRDTGRARWGASLTDTNVFGQMDQLTGRFQIGEGAVAVGARYNIPVHSSGTVLGFSYSYSHVKVGGDFKALNVKGDATSYGVDVYQPVYRKSYADIALTTGFDLKSAQNNMLGQKAGRDDLRILNTGINIETTDRYGKTYFPHSFHFGFSDFMGSSPKNHNGSVRANASSQFFIYRTSMIRYTRLPLGMMHSLRGSAQLTDFSLPPSEQFRLGGAFSVRGYSEGDYMADYGAFLCNEVFIPTYFFPKGWRLPHSKEMLRNQIQGVGFFDFGGGGLRSPLAGERDTRMLSGGGGGIRVHLFDKVFARLQWAGRTGSKPSTGSDGVFYYGVSAEY
ncbi:MAG: ShlB/FhaC/HecB family hemolysin secretion/activation protein [Candidatus Omnitrophota bacterium]|jgi:hemolysin activation/secretion protein